MFRKSKVLLLFTVFTLVIALFLGSTASFASNNFTSKKLYVDENSIKFIQNLNSNFKMRMSSEEEDLKCYTCPNIISSKVNSTWMWFNLIDFNHNDVTGIKVSKIEIFQSGNLIARTNKVKSRSISGEYTADNIEFIDSFANENGENFVDIVFYLGSNEVARVKDYILEVYSDTVVTEVYPYEIGTQSNKFNIEIEAINVEEDANIDVYLADDLGNKITKIDKVIYEYYDEESYEKRIEFGLSFLNDEYLKNYGSYDVVVTADDRELKIVDSCYINIDININITDQCYINGVYDAEMPDLEYKVIGINIINNGPYKLVIEQEGVVTKEIEGIQAIFDDDTYQEVISIPLLPEYFSKYGEMYSTELYDQDGEIIDRFIFLEPIDDTSNIPDEVNPFEGYEVFEKQENIEPDKIWRVKFNKAINFDSINKSSVYVINKWTGLSIDVDYELESDGSVLAITPLNDGFDFGETYILIIENKVKSSSGVNLSKPAMIEFTIIN